MALKYLVTFASEEYIIFTAHEYELEIHDSAYVGDPIPIRLSPKEFVTSPHTNADVLHGVVVSKFEINLLGDDTLNAKAVYVSNPRNTLVKLTSTPSGTVQAVGYLVADDVSEDYVDGFKVIKIGATDGLDSLKNFTFEISGEGKRATGVHTLFDIVRYCLEKTGLELNIVTEYPYYQKDDVYDEDYCTLKETSVYADIFNEKTCEQVLAEIAETLGLRIFQYIGQWYVIYGYTFNDTDRFYQIWDFEGNFISSNDFNIDLNATFLSTYKPAGDTNETQYVQAIGEAITTLDILNENTNIIPNGFINDGEYDIGGADETPVKNWYNYLGDHPVDDFSKGGLGTKKDPFYLQIDGYQPDNVNRYRTRGSVKNWSYDADVDDFGAIRIMSAGDDPLETLDFGFRLTLKVKGKNVKSANVLVLIKIEMDDDNKISYVLTEGGSFERVSDNLFVDRAKIQNSIRVDLIDSYGNNKDTYSTVSVESESMQNILANKSFLSRIQDGISNGFKKYKVEDIVGATVELFLYEALGVKSSPTDADRWVRYAEVKLEYIDKSRGVGLKKNRYSSKLDNGATKKNEKKAYFGDYYNANNFTSMLKPDGSPTRFWNRYQSLEENELLMLINKDLISMYAVPLAVYDGELMNTPPPIGRYTMAGYDNKLTVTNINTDFGGNVADVRLQQLATDYVDSTDTKKGVFDGTSDGEEELEYTDQYPPTKGTEQSSAVIVNEENLTSETQWFADGTMAIEPIYDEDGFATETRISFFDAGSGDLQFQIGSNGGQFTIFAPDGTPLEIATEFRDYGLNWMKACDTFASEPVLLGTIPELTFYGYHPEGEIWGYTYAADRTDNFPTTLYRHVPTPYDITYDVFYYEYDPAGLLGSLTDSYVGGVFGCRNGFPEPPLHG